jgi:hypothetical protein
MVEYKGGQSEKRCIGDGLNGCRARERFQDAHLAKEISRRQGCEFKLGWLAKMFADPDLAFTDEKEAIPNLSLTHNDVAGWGLDFFGSFPQQVQSRFVETGEDRYVL